VVDSCRIFTRNARTCALVKMGSVQEAANAVRTLPGFLKEKADPSFRWVVKFAEADLGASNRGDGKGIGKGSKGKYDTDPSDNLYVKGLPLNITDAQLQSTFAQAGKVVETKILRYPDAKECSALIRMGSVADAEHAMDVLQGAAPEGSVPPLTIRFRGKDSVASDNLFVKGLTVDFSQEDLHELFSSCGTVRRCRLLDTPAKHSAPDAVALVQMASPQEAAMAIETLSGRVPSGMGPQMTIRFAAPKAETVSEDVATDNVYAKGLPLGTPDYLLRPVFAQFGTVVRLKVLEPREGEATDCAALIQMSSVEEAKAAVENLNGHVLAAPLPPMRVRYAGKDQAPASNLYVAGLPLSVQEPQLKAIFAGCGSVVRLRLLKQPGRLETHALVQMSTAEEATECIKQLNGVPPEGSMFWPTLVVRFATNRAQQGRGEGKTKGSEGPRVPGSTQPEQQVRIARRAA